MPNLSEMELLNEFQRLNVTGFFVKEILKLKALPMQKDFISELLRITSTVESPESFLKWSGYATIAAVLRDHIYINFVARNSRVYPNLYVLLVGDSGNTRKSTPLKICNKLVSQIGNTKLIEGRASIQGVLKELSQLKVLENGRKLEGASGLLYTEELAAFLVKDPSAMSIMTDIYDFKEKTSIILKGEENVTLKNVVVSLIAATNVAFLTDMFTKVDLFGGFVGRTVIITEEKARFRNLGLRDTATESDWARLTAHLNLITQFKGPATITKEAEDYLENWYQNLHFSSDSKTGFESRVHTLVFKLMMIIAACDMTLAEFKGELNILHAERAIAEIALLLPNYHKLVHSVNPTTNMIASVSTRIMELLFINPDKAYIEHPTLLGGLFGQCDSETFDKAINTLLQMEFISTGSNVSGKITYSATEKAKHAFLLNIKGKVQ